MGQDDTKYFVWEYHNGNWQRIEDPLDFSEDPHDVDKAEKKSGYVSSAIFSLTDDTDYAVCVQRNDSSAVTYPFHFTIDFVGSIESVFVRDFPNAIQLLHLLSPGCISRFMNFLEEEYFDVIEVLTREAKGVVNREYRERKQRQKTGSNL